MTGTFTASDDDYYPPLNYSVTTAPTHGTLDVNANGSYIYTPSQAAAFDGTTDSFAVSVSDAGAGFHIHGLGGLLNLLTFGLLGSSGHTATVTVPVTITPWLQRPSIPNSVTVGNPDATTGQVSGQAAGDGTASTYSAPATTAKGSISINASTGAFTYTPTVTARHSASGLGSTIVATITLSNRGGTNVGVTLSPDGTRAYIPAGFDGIAVIDTATNAVIATIPQPSYGFQPSTVAVSPDGTRIAYPGYHSGLAVIDARTNSLITTIKSGLGVPLGDPRSAVFSPDGKRLFVGADYGPVTVIDPATNTVVDHFGNWAYVDGIAISPDGNHLYVSSGTTLSVIDTNSSLITNNIQLPNGGGLITISPNGKTAYVATFSGLTVIDTATNVVTRNLSLPQAVKNVALSPDGTRAYLSRPNGVSVMDTATNAIIGMPFVTADVVDRITLSADGKSAYVEVEKISNDSTTGYQSTQSLVVLNVSEAGRASTDSFNVTITDKSGTSSTIPVRVSILPSNSAPVVGTPTVGTPDAATGAVTGKIVVTDADNDPITYLVQAQGTTYQGTVTVDPSTGTFYYTPSLAGWRAAHNAGATEASKTDSFSVVISDGHGGIVTDTISVKFA